MFALNHPRAVALMVVNAALWATAGVVTRQLDSAASFEITFWRSLFTLGTLVLVLPLLHGQGFWVSLRHAGVSLWLSGVCWSVMFTAFMIALTLTSVANVLITLALSPLFTALVARVVTGQPVPTRTWVAIGLAGLGIAWMFSDQLGGPGVLAGMSVALGVPVATSINWTVVQRARQQGMKLDLAPAVMIGAFISCLLTLPLAWPLQGSGGDIAWLALLGVFQLALPCVMAVWCARVLHAAEVSLLALLEVIFGIALAWWGAGEEPGQRVLVGGALVLLALSGNGMVGLAAKKP
ncbi:MAG: DMT family transporter [Alphaproteobacteria bacterium]|nr:DMT family transporter [Alphaproteobacteria bacterium]